MMINIPIDIRNARISDLSSMKKILNTKELGWGYSTNYFKRLINDKGGIFLIAEHASKIIGIVYGEFNEKEDWAELTGIAVLEEYRNQGLGSRLIREFEKIIQSKNISAIEIFAHINTLAKHIDKLGYEKGGVYMNCRKKIKMKIILISCVSKKLSYKDKAKNLYISPLFKLAFKYAKSLQPDKIFILSAKYGLLNLEDEILPYNETLNNMPEAERKQWASNILEKLKQQADLEKDEIIFLAGEKYRKYLIPHITNYKVPMKGLGIGKQLQFLKQKTTNPCSELHNLFNNMQRHSFPFNENEIPKNGIYILFEKGEKAHNGDRIVRIGTHTGENQLPSRLRQHFLKENKDRSIFRKNIGRALLNKQQDHFLQDWELDLTTREAKEKWEKEINLEKQKQIEKQVTEYIQQNFSFVVFPIENKEKRLEIESKIISTISLCKNCKPSPEWFGLFSPKEKIKESGLWLVNELYKQSLSSQELEELKSLIK